MIRITVLDTQTAAHATVDIPGEHGPALRSAITEIRNELGERVSGMHKFKKEHALTRAMSAIGRLAATVNLIITQEDPDYE